MSDPSDPSDPTGPTEPVPASLRILASGENLGALRSVHRPAGPVGRIRFRSARLYLFDHGLVLCLGDGARLTLFRVGRMRIKDTNGRAFLLAGPDGRMGFLAAQWSDGAAPARALAGWAPGHPWGRHPSR
jgi:hypothetical protein